MRRKRQFSAARFLSGTLVIYVLLLVMSALLSLSAYSFIRGQSEKNFEKSFSLYASRVDESLGRSSYRLLNYLLNDSNVAKIGGNPDDLETINAIRNLRITFATLETNDNNYYNYFFYNYETGAVIDVRAALFDINLYNKGFSILQDQMLDGRIAQTAGLNAWTIVSEGEGICLLRVFRFQDYYAGIWIMADKAFQILGGVSDADSYPLLIGKNGSLYSLAEQLDSPDEIQQITSRRERGRTVFEYPLKNGDFSILYVIMNQGLYRNALFIQGFLAVISVSLILFGLLLLQRTRRSIVEPIRTLSEHLEEYNRSNEAIGEQDVLELKEAGSVMRELMKQVEELKVQAYEEKINRQNIEYDYLEQQIMPHFYLNCLNIIYNMVGAGKQEEIQHFSLLVSRYLRALFREGLKVYPLSEELSLVQDYLEIQQIRYGTSFRVEIDEPEETDLMIPPLVILTLVENSVKHNLDPDAELVIRTTIVSSDSKLTISVEDNGKGFPEQVLEQLSRGEQPRPENGRGIGLWNCRERLSIIYNHDYSMEFQNHSNGGAIVTLVLPKRRQS